MIVYEPFDIWVSLVAALVGLCVGSFANVITYRLPIIKGLGPFSDGVRLAELKRETGRFNLAVPSSACPSCGDNIKPWFNIPLFGWLALGGKCFSCKSSISSGYPLIELLFGVVFFMIAYTDGVTPASLARFVMVLFVYCAARIYRDTAHVYKPYVAVAVLLLILQVVFGGLGYAYTP